MYSWSALLAEIRHLTEEAALSGVVLDVAQLADGLFRRHPDSGMTINEICRSIERAAIEVQAIVLTGSDAAAASVWSDLDHKI